MDELYIKINERLEEQSQEDAFRSQIESINKLLIEKYPLELPQSYIDADKEAHLNDYVKQLGDEVETMSAKDFEKISESVEKNSLYHLQLFFLMRKIAAENNIQVNNEDITHELTRQINLMSSGRNNIDLSDREGLKEQLYNIAFDRKIKKFLIDRLAIDD